MFQKQTYEELEQRIQELKKEAYERKRVEEALEESETRYRRLFETAQDGILILNADTEQIEDANQFIIDMLGFSIEEIAGKRLWEIGPFKDIQASQQFPFIVLLTYLSQYIVKISNIFTTCCGEL